MKTQLLLHKDTKTSANNFLQHPTHALIIEGKVGAGKDSLANELAANILNLPQEKLNNYQYLLKIEPAGNTVSIEAIRQAQQFLKLKTTGDMPIRRVLIVQSAELMSIEAQNAFLKILEEPPVDTIMLILTNSQSKLLPTIRSRAQTINLKKLSRQEVNKFFSEQGYTEDVITAAYHAANAQIGLMRSILDDKESNKQLESLKQAKQILGTTKFDRLIYIESVAKQKEDLPDFIRGLVVTCQSAMKVTAERGNFTQSKSWHRRFSLAVRAEERLASNPNSKLLLTDLMLNL